MKRNVIQKIQRLNEIREQYSDQILALAKTQLDIHQKIIKEFNLGGDYEERYILRYDYLNVGPYGDVQLWETGRCGDRDEELTTIQIDDRILAGDLAGYEQYLRSRYAKKAEQAEIARKKEQDLKREKLQKEILRMSEELGKLTS